MMNTIPRQKFLAFSSTWLVLLTLLVSGAAEAASRLKDIVRYEGVRENLLVGYGLVVGLNGTGDKLNNNAFTEQSLVSFLERLGVNTRDSKLKTKNVAAVTVTASLPAFARQGSRLDVSVSALGDAKSLQGGTLLATPLYGADGEVYAVAQGSIAIGGYEASGDSGSSITKGVPTNGQIANGGIIEREIGFALNALRKVNLSLRNPDISTSYQIAQAVNTWLGEPVAEALDSGTVQVDVPASYQGNVTGLLAEIEQLDIQPDQVAKIVIDEASGTIVMGENVRIDNVAVAQGNLVVRINETPQVSQPGAFAPDGAQTAVVPRTELAVDEGSENRLAELNTGASLKELVQGLNALGIGPRDLITILQTVKAAGALQAEIEAR